MDIHFRRVVLELDFITQVAEQSLEWHYLLAIDIAVKESRHVFARNLAGNRDHFIVFEFSSPDAKGIKHSAHEIIKALRSPRRLTNSHIQRKRYRPSPIVDAE